MIFQVSQNSYLLDTYPTLKVDKAQVHYYTTLFLYVLQQVVDNLLINRLCFMLFNVGLLSNERSIF